MKQLHDAITQQIFQSQTSDRKTNKAIALLALQALRYEAVAQQMELENGNQSIGNLWRSAPDDLGHHHGAS